MKRSHKMEDKDLEKELFDKTELNKPLEDKVDSKEKDINLVKEGKKENKKNKKSKLEDQLDSLKSELEEMKDKYYRNLAEMENYKKRTSNEMIKERKYASQSLTDKLIDSLEVLTQATNTKTNDKQMENFLYGFKMIKDMMLAALKDEGLSIIETKVGDKFDPNIHEAMETEYNPELSEGIITKVSKTGYKFKDRVLRPTLVVINLKTENKDIDTFDDIEANNLENGEEE